MLSEIIATAMATATIVGWLLHLLYMEREYMEARRKMIQKACQENAKAAFREED